jgi:hypothetical protein
MIVVVGTDGVHVEAPEDLRRFHVQAPPGVDAAAALAAVGFGRGAGDGGDDLLVSVAAVRAAVSGQVDPNVWEPQFAAMLDYAGSKGWLSDDGTMIRAHVERE